MSYADYYRIEKAIRFIEANSYEQPSLEAVAAHLSLSPFHFQRMFTEWAGISPKRFLQCLTIESAKRLLDESRSVLETSIETGLSGPSRLHDLFVSVDAVTPGEYKNMGEGLVIRYGFQPTPFGMSLIGVTERGICAFSFPDDENSAIETLRSDWQNAKLVRDDNAAEETVSRIFKPEKGSRLKILMKGTNFQIKVWTAVLRLPYGVFSSYGRVAEMIGQPSASRAVGTALGQNRIGYLIPCHRVLRETGAVTGYRWGSARKRAMIAFEACTKG